MKKKGDQQSVPVVDQDAKRLALGRLVEGTIHEVNNPLSIIRMNSELVVEQFKRMGTEVTPELQKILDRSHKIIGMCDRIARTMKTLRFIATGNSHEGVLDIPLEELLQSLIPLCSNRCQKRGVEFITEIDPLSDGQATIKVAELAQAIIELINDRVEGLQNQTEKWIKMEVRKKGSAGTFTITDSRPDADSHAFKMSFALTTAPGYTHD